MRFSIVTCTYNRAEHLKRCLDSTCAQDFDKYRFEIVVIDNNSPDQTALVCKEYIDRYTDIQISYTKEMQQGLSFALNKGIDIAKGEYIIYIDDDETIDSNYLTLLDKYLIEYPEAKFAASKVIPRYESQKPKWLSAFTMRLITGSFDKGNKVLKLNTKNYPGTGHTIIQRQLYAKVGKFNTELGRKGSSLMGAEDKDMSIRLISNNTDCYYFPQLAIYHHIPASKLTTEHFHKLTYSIGKSERLRTQSIAKGVFYIRIFDECIKWAASVVLCIAYTLGLAPNKGWKLIQFRWNVSKGLLGL